ncbi:MAG: hypothetical protein NC390_02100 [Fusobacterium sp.]|nr:hypothetical protein [Fusobacterium sp.]
MRIFVLFLVILLSFNAALAESSFPIDEEFVTDFVEYDVKEAKALEKQQKAQAKIDKKRAKLEEKKAALEKKRDAGIENCERNQVYIEKLRATIVEPSDVEENL